MDRGNVFSGSSFRATLYGAVAFLVVLGISGILAIAFVERQLLAEIRTQVEESIDGLQLDYEAAPDGFVPRVEHLSVLLSRLNRLAVLFDADGNRIAGTAAVAPDFDGWIVRKVAPPDGQGPAEDVYLTAVRIGPMTLVLGRDLRFVRHFEDVVVRAFVAVGATMTLLLIAIGYWMSRQTQIKLEAMADTLQRVADGAIDARLTPTEDNDQVDRIARIMNLHLETLSSLMETMKTSAAAIAHDLKRPLSRAYLRLDKVLDDLSLAPAAKADLEAVHDELTRLTAIFETILRIARIDGEQGRPLQDWVDLGQLAAELGDTYQVVAEESGMTLAVAIDAGQRLLVRGDPGMLGQMIANLLQNAVTHCPAGTAIALGVEATADDVCLVVSDTGAGLPEEERRQVLKSFYRSNTARTTEGTGLGLALVNSIVKRHRAEIALEDNGPGLKVRIRFGRQGLV